MSKLTRDLTIVFLSFCSCVSISTAQTDRVSIDFGKPEIWTLDEAHYLLRNVKENSGAISVQALTNLNPNETNASSVRMLRSAFEASLVYDEPVQIANRLKLDNYNYELSRKRELEQNLDDQRMIETSLIADIALLDIEIAALPESEENNTIRTEKNTQKLSSNLSSPEFKPK
ncbi:MAG: hypothetical protein GKR91_05975 [Pseudomonadales bacterium]|nr:hypothetical protein [Pseudomonadales bacterium]